MHSQVLLAVQPCLFFLLRTIASVLFPLLLKWAHVAMIVGWRTRLSVEERGQCLNLLSNFVGNILIWLKWRVHLLHCWWDCKMVQALWRTVWRFLKKVKIELPYGPAIPLLGIYPDKNMIWKNTCIPVSTAALFIITKKQSKCPLTEEW